MNPSDSPSGDNESDFNGGVNDTTPPTVADAPEYTGGVNSVEEQLTKLHNILSQQQVLTRIILIKHQQQKQKIKKNFQILVVKIMLQLHH